MLAQDQSVKLEISIQETLACITLRKPVQIAGLGAEIFELVETSCARKMGL
jgi:hypothetical protein